jgi:hypothetical protein
LVRPHPAANRNAEFPEFFDRSPIGSKLLVRGYNEEETTRQHDMASVSTPTGSRGSDSHGCVVYWRFYLPFGDVELLRAEGSILPCAAAWPTLNRATQVDATS